MIQQAIRRILTTDPEAGGFLLSLPVMCTSTGGVSIQGGMLHLDGGLEMSLEEWIWTLRRAVEEAKV